MSSIQTPYVTPSVLKMAATGIAWDTIPNTYQGQSKDAAILDICWRATSEVDSFCNIPLRATINKEHVEGPSFYVTVSNGVAGTARIILSRPPVIAVTAVTVIPSADFTNTPTAVPTGLWRVLDPLIGELGTLAPDSSGALPNAIRLAPGYVNWTLGRNGWLIEVTYVNGWPHAGLTQTATSGATLLHLDDVTGMDGMAVTLKDGANTEVVTASAPSATSGAGTVTCTATQYAHNPGTVATTLPGAIEKAAIKLATEEALQRGALTISAQQMGGSIQSSGAGRAKDLIEQAHMLLHPFKRVI